MSFLVANFQNKAFFPVLTPFTGAGTDDLAGGFDNPPAVDWHCVPANLHVLRCAISAPSVFIGGTTVQPRLGGADAGAALVLPPVTHSIAGDVAVLVPPVAVFADLETNKLGAHMSTVLNVGRISWQLRFDAPFASWQLFASGWPASVSAGQADSGTTQHIPPFSYAIQQQPDLKTVPWPVPGTFQYLLAVTMTNPAQVDSPSFEMGLQVNGADSFLVTTPPVTNGTLTNLMLDTTSTQHVDAGDLVQFVFRRTDAGGNQPTSGTRFYLSIGFLPD